MSLSGGVAYVYDEDGTFDSRCNLAQVELEPVETEKSAAACRGEEARKKAAVRHLGRVDETLLKGLLEKHSRYTGSRQARKILDDWENSLRRFIKIMPNEYRRALNEIVARSEKQQETA